MVKQVTTIRLGEKMLEKAKKKAEDQEKSLAEYIRYCIEKDLKEDKTKG